MNVTASTAAWALHDLGLATSLGGTLYGRVALHPAVGTISDEHERGELVHHTWRRFNRVNLLSHAVFATTWLLGRGWLLGSGVLNGRLVDATTRNLIMAKDVLITSAVASGVTSAIVGELGMREPDTKRPAAMNQSGSVSADEDEVPKMAERITGAAGIINMVSLAGVIGITAILAMRAGRSPRLSMLSRLVG